MHHDHHHPRRRSRWALAVGVLANLGILFHFKYTRFLIENAYYVLHGMPAPPASLPDIVLPVGVSFIVFEKITYLVDIYRRVSRPAPSFPTYLLYVFLFPKLLAGPIIKYHELDAQLATIPVARWEDFSAGFVRFMMGVVKKVLIADTLATGADRVFSADPHAVGGQDGVVHGVEHRRPVHVEQVKGGVEVVLDLAVVANRVAVEVAEEDALGAPAAERNAGLEGDLADVGEAEAGDGGPQVGRIHPADHHRRRSVEGG